MGKHKVLNTPAIRRIPTYLHKLMLMHAAGEEFVSTSKLADYMDLDPIIEQGAPERTGSDQTRRGLFVPAQEPTQGRDEFLRLEPHAGGPLDAGELEVLPHDDRVQVHVVRQLGRRHEFLPGRVHEHELVQIGRDAPDGGGVQDFVFSHDWLRSGVELSSYYTTFSSEIKFFRRFFVKRLLPREEKNDICVPSGQPVVKTKKEAAGTMRGNPAASRRGRIGGVSGS